MKSVCAFTRRPDMTRAEFQRYYEEQHAPLGIRYFAFRAYVRNHVVDGQCAEIETISEFWADDLARLAAVLDGPAGPIFAADEARFMDRTRTAPAAAEERILSPGPLTDANGLRWAALLCWSGEAVPAGLYAWALEAAACQPGVSLDILAPRQGQGARFPAQALLWLPDFALAPPPPSEFAVRALRMRRVRTPDADLLPKETKQGGT